MLAVNLTGVFNTFRAAVPHMIECGYGRLVATSSGAGRTGTPHLSHYAATKWGVIGFVKSVALEVAAHGITANVVCPATVDTPMVHNKALYSLFAPDIAEPTKDSVARATRRSTRCASPGSIRRRSPTPCCSSRPTAATFISGETIEISAGGSAQR